MMDKGISIITSFGCKFNCWFCIMKQHSLFGYNKPFDLDKLKQFLIDNRFTSELSVSGGGDPLNNFSKHRDFYYNFLFPTVKKIRMPNMDGIDIHTRIPLMDADFWRNVNRCVFSIDFQDGNIIGEDFIRWIHNIHVCKLRLFYCILPTTRDEDIESLISLSKELNCQVSVKQLHGHEDDGRFQQISHKYPELFKVYDRNYLTYYMPNNTITDTFMF